MKICIEDAATLQFLTPNGRWTAHTREAITFPNSQVAKQAGAKVAIGRFNIVGFFKDSPQLTNLDEGHGSAAVAKA
jgi:hypothetical protein